jgi:hypothetical protein
VKLGSKKKIHSFTLLFFHNLILKSHGARNFICITTIFPFHHLVIVVIKTILAIKEDNCEDVKYIDHLISKDGIVRCENMLLGFILKNFGFKVIRNTGPVVQFISNTKRLKLELNKTFSPVRVSKKINFIWMNGIEILSLQTV